MRLRVIFALFCFLIAMPLAAQTPDTATIRGTVVDVNNAPIAGAHMTVHNGLTGEVRAVDSGTAGRFSVSGLAVAGEYSISATCAGFARSGAAPYLSFRRFKRRTAVEASNCRRDFDGHCGRRGG